MIASAVKHEEACLFGGLLGDINDGDQAVEKKWFI